MITGTCIRCLKCGEEKPEECFGVDRVKKSGRRCWCKPCYKVYQLEWRLQREYGMSTGDYERMLLAQSGGCAICGKVRAHKGRKGQGLFVDHDHVTGAVRGLLCFDCNTGIGMLGDDPARIRLAAAYLERTGAIGAPS